MASTYEVYVQICNSFIDFGYKTSNFNNEFSQNLELLLRHDIDASLTKAVELATVEAETNLSSTYFVLLDTEFYNPLSFSGKMNLNKILDLGHQIGLHYDIRSMRPNESLDEFVDTQCRILEAAICSPIEVVAAHRPAALCPDVLGLDTSLAGREHAYHPRYFKPGLYASDSSGYWGSVAATPPSTGESFQLLTHPYLWGYSNSDLQRSEKLEIVLKYRVEEINSEFKRQFNSQGNSLCL